MFSHRLIRLGPVKRMKTSLTLLGLLCIALNANAVTVYQCTDAKNIVSLQQQQCAAGDKQVVVSVDGRSPSEKKTEAGKVWKVLAKGTPTVAERCVDAWRPTLKDPDSGRLADQNDGGVVIMSPTRKVLIAEGRARNGFGGMNVQYFLCDLDDDAKIIGNGNPYGDLREKADDIREYPGVGLSIAFPGLPSR
jgi:hypothetical protein